MIGSVICFLVKYHLVCMGCLWRLEGGLWLGHDLMNEYDYFTFAGFNFVVLLTYFIEL